GCWPDLSQGSGSRPSGKFPVVLQHLQQSGDSSLGPPADVAYSRGGSRAVRGVLISQGPNQGRHGYSGFRANFSRRIEGFPTPSLVTLEQVGQNRDELVSRLA